MPCETGTSLEVCQLLMCLWRKLGTEIAGKVTYTVFNSNTQLAVPYLRRIFRVGTCRFSALPSAVLLVLCLKHFFIPGWESDNRETKIIWLTITTCISSVLDILLLTNSNKHLSVQMESKSS